MDGAMRENFQFRVGVETQKILESGGPNQEASHKYVRFFNLYKFTASTADRDIAPIIGGMSAHEVKDLRDKLTEALER